MEMAPVKSSNIASVGYDAERAELYVQFRSGGLYTYSGVPETEAAEMVKSASVGNYFATRIKGKYTYRQEA